MENRIKGRFTNKKLIEWINNKFLDLEINEWEVFEIVNTRFRSHDYEGGACKLIIHFRHKTEESILSNSQFLSFYSIGELEDYCKNGYDLCLTFGRRVYTLNNLELDLKKTP